ncbi:MAG: DUF393 domain-containing protein [Pseudomonadota bacterium]
MTENDKLTVYYNGECPICRREVDAYKRTAERKGVDVNWRDIAGDEAALAESGFSADAAAKRFHVKDADGVMHAGVDAFQRLWLKLPGFGWLGRILQWRPVKRAATALYEGVLAPALFAMHKRRQKRKGAV